ncbi:MAG: helix-turn-helix transcriptional regulator [Kofleriaceae bacterium]
MTAPALDPVYRRVGERIAALRQARAVTQAELAERIGVGTGYIGKIESGTRRIQLETLRQIATALRAPLASLLPEPRTIARERGPGYRGVRPSTLSDDEVRELVELLDQLDRPTAQALLTLVRRVGGKR